MTNLRKIVSIYLFLFIVFNITAQSEDPVVAMVGENPIYKSALEFAYNKSGKKIEPDQFLKSVIDIKLKVLEAEEKHLSEKKDFKDEYNGYVDILLRGYMQDTTSLSRYAKKAYDRRLENIQIEEIFVPYSSFPVYPKDTLAAYNEMQKILSELNSDGTNFSTIASKYKPRQQEGMPLVGTTKWITSMVVEAPFEDVIYNASINTITAPVRTNIGYSVAKVLDRKADKGDVDVSHILFMYPHANATLSQRDSVKQVAKKVYTELQNGADFKKLCSLYSSDKTTSSNGGDLGWYGVLNPLPDAINAELEKIKPSEITSLIESPIGYVVLKLNDRRFLKSWLQAKTETIDYILENPRKREVKALEVEKLSTEVPYVINGMVYGYLEQLANVDFPDTDLFVDKAKPFMDEVVLSCGVNNYTVSDFVDYIDSNKSRLSSTSTDVLHDYLNEFIFAKALIQKETNLYALYPELNNIAKEYYDGLLAFEITNAEVWDKAQKDKKGLEQTFNQNSEKYKWSNPKFDGYVVHARNQEILDKVAQVIKDNKSNSINIVSLLKDEFNKDDNQIIIEKGLWQKGDNQFVDNVLYKVPVRTDKISYPVFLIEGETVQQPRNYEDVKGQVVADYQLILESKWLNLLREKYNIVINEDVLSSIK